MEHKPYNGYWNYETWAVGLSIDNDESEQELWAEQAEKLDIDALEVALKEYHEEAAEAGKEQLPTFAKDLLDAAFSEVNWRELARGLKEEAEAEAEEVSA